MNQTVGHDTLMQYIQMFFVSTASFDSCLVLITSVRLSSTIMQFNLLSQKLNLLAPHIMLYPHTVTHLTSAPFCKKILSQSELTFQSHELLQMLAILTRQTDTPNKEIGNLVSNREMSQKPAEERGKQVFMQPFCQYASNSM